MSPALVVALAALVVWVFPAMLFVGALIVSMIMRGHEDYRDACQRVKLHRHAREVAALEELFASS